VPALTRPRETVQAYTTKLARGIALAALVLGAACKRGSAEEKAKVTHNWTPPRPAEVAGVPAATVDSAIARRIAADPPARVTKEHWDHVRALYAAYGGAALWMEKGGPNEERTTALLRAILDAHTDAIRLDAYPLDELAQKLTAVREAKNTSADALADADVLLTTTYTALAEDLLQGQADPRKLSQDWFIDVRRERLDSAVAYSLRADRLDAGIASMRPQDEEYAALQKALLNFRKLVNDGGWGAVPEGKTLKPGEKAPAVRLAALRARLAAEGFLGDSTSPADTVAAQLYDPTLAGAVATFQAHHGIVVDSALGKETVESMNVPADYRLAQIAANLERYRWMPRHLGDRYIFVNVPAFQLTAFDGGEKALQMKVIVGAEFEGRRTPVFADSMETVVFRPYWNIPPEIQAKEIEPKIAEDPSYMTKERLEYFKDGSRTGIRQLPGGKNSLGLVKFLFPNSYNIYLHDTPEDALFDKDVRAFSHGCIRLEQPMELASWVLGWDMGKVQEYEGGKDNQSVRLPTKLPVYITYLTTYTRDGQLYFGNDLYGRDDKLVQEIASGRFASAEAVRELAALRKLVDD
jgi:L,D-transpeptidase YcbB